MPLSVSQDESACGSRDSLPNSGLTAERFTVLPSESGKLTPLRGEAARHGPDGPKPHGRGRNTDIDRQFAGCPAEPRGQQRGARISSAIPPSATPCSACPLLYLPLGSHAALRIDSAPLRHFHGETRTSVTGHEMLPNPGIRIAIVRNRGRSCSPGIRSFLRTILPLVNGSRTSPLLGACGRRVLPSPHPFPSACGIPKEKAFGLQSKEGMLLAAWRKGSRPAGDIRVATLLPDFGKSEPWSRG